MSGFVQEFGSGSTSSSATTTYQVNVVGTVPVGDALVASIVSLNGVSPIASVSAVDSKGNTWNFLYSDQVGSTSTVTHMLYANITNALTSSDTITFTYSDSFTRTAVHIAQFNDTLTPDMRADGDNGGVSWNTLLTNATATTSQANELVVGAWGLVNAGRIFTATNGFTTLTKYASVVGSGERAIAAEYKYVSATGAYTANGTLNSSGTASGIVQTFTLSAAPPARSGRPKVWNGTAWVAHDAKVWNGTAWVEHEAKAYDGSSWVKSK